MATRGTAGKRPVKRSRRTLRVRRPSLATAIWGVISLGLTIAFLLVQGVLLLTLMMISILVTTISAFADFAGDPAAVPAPTKKRAGSADPRGSRSTRGSSAAVRCTVTGRPTDDCPCPGKHVTTSRGAQRYKKPIGTPYGKAKGGPKVSTSKRDRTVS